MMFQDRGPTVSLGTKRFLHFGKRTLRITPQQARAHMHVLGKTGSGKSYFLAGLFLSFHEAGMPVTLIDPHGDLAELVLAHLADSGEFSNPEAYERLVYLDVPAAAAAGLYLPFNYLEQPYDDHAMAELVDLPEPVFPRTCMCARACCGVMRRGHCPKRKNRFVPSRTVGPR